MKRKLMVTGDIRYKMKDMFGIDDKDVDQVIKFMEKDYGHIFDVIKIAADSNDLTDRQKMFISYIVGNTSAMQSAELDNMSINRHDMDTIPPNVGM